MSHSLSPLLAQAIDRHQNHLIGALIAQGADPNARVEGLSMLARAISSENAQAALELLEAGALANDPPSPTPPLALAIGSLGDSALDVVARLIEQGADVNAKDSFGEPLLHTAIHYGHDQIALALISAGADPEARDPHMGFSALARCVADDCPRIAQALIERGADLWALSLLGLDVLDIAVEEDRLRPESGYAGMIISAREKQALSFGESAGRAGERGPRL